MNKQEHSFFLNLLHDSDVTKYINPKEQDVYVSYIQPNLDDETITYLLDDLSMVDQVKNIFGIVLVKNNCEKNHLYVSHNDEKGNTIYFDTDVLILNKDGSLDSWSESEFVGLETAIKWIPKGFTKLAEFSVKQYQEQFNLNVFNYVSASDKNFEEMSFNEQINSLLSIVFNSYFEEQMDDSNFDCKERFTSWVKENGFIISNKTLTTNTKDQYLKFILNDMATRNNINVQIPKSKSIQL